LVPRGQPRLLINYHPRQRIEVRQPSHHVEQRQFA
jgi:hypothetical protein